MSVLPRDARITRSENELNPHRYICECPDRHCQERITLRPARYRRLAALGNVVSPFCYGGRRVLHWEDDVVVVQARSTERAA